MRGSIGLLVLPLLVACNAPSAQDTTQPEVAVAAPAETEVAETTAVAAKPAEATKPAVVSDSGRRYSSRISIDVVDVPLPQVVDAIGRQVGKNILVDPDVEETVTLTLRDVRWTVALDLIARRTRCQIEQHRGILLLTQPPKVSMQYTDANVRSVIQMISAYSGKNVIISPEVQGKITLELKDVHWRDALEAVVKTAGDYEVVGESTRH